MPGGMLVGLVDYLDEYVKSIIYYQFVYSRTPSCKFAVYKASDEVCRNSPPPKKKPLFHFSFQTCLLYSGAKGLEEESGAASWEAKCIGGGKIIP